MNKEKERETEEHVDPVFIRQRELRVEYADNTAFLLDIRVSSTELLSFCISLHRPFDRCLKPYLTPELNLSLSFSFVRLVVSSASMLRIYFLRMNALFTHIETVCLFGQRTVYSVDKYSNICRYLSSVWYGRFKRLSNILIFVKYAMWLVWRGRKRGEGNFIDRDKLISHVRIRSLQWGGVRGRGRIEGIRIKSW